MTGHITGGSLRTLDQADDEILQANWWPADIKQLQRDVPLRTRDMFSLINAGKRWYESKPFSGLPVDVGHVSASLRLVLANCIQGKKNEVEEVSVLMRGGAGTSSTLPVVVCGSQLDPIGETLKVVCYGSCRTPDPFVHCDVYT